MTSVTTISCHSNGKSFQVGDEVQNNEARFFIGAINDSHGLCAIDLSKPFSLLDPASKMAPCIRQGLYSANMHTLNLTEPKP